jgi:hypothetical protein
MFPTSTPPVRQRDREAWARVTNFKIGSASFHPIWDKQHDPPLFLDPEMLTSGLRNHTGTEKYVLWAVRLGDISYQNEAFQNLHRSYTRCV